MADGLIDFQIEGVEETLKGLEELTTLPDGLIIMNLTMTTIPTITGGSPNEPFIHRVDIHYLSTNVGTKDKTPDFYA